jgi:hypothetical protein
MKESLFDHITPLVEESGRGFLPSKQAFLPARRVPCRRWQTVPQAGEARNALARAVFFNRLGEIRDRGFEQQRYRASGLNLLTAAIVLWNTVYLERAANALRDRDQGVDDALLKHLSPLGWEHINLTGDYTWRNSAKSGTGKFRPLRHGSRS